MRDIQTVLKAWANVRVSRRMGTEFPSTSAGMSGAVNEFDFRPILIEEEAELVDIQ